ncbi:MAG TPA: radical SAM protein [Saprospiraceae bacterium]|nr:radical SAM protein [Saprospiraceae bacterium]HMQ85654.1 radical SAM protein [Saprospiraceae bacterium]
MTKQVRPYVLFADNDGNVYEDTSLYAIGRSGYYACPIPDDDWMELPDGGSLYHLPQRRPVGIDRRTGEMRMCEKGWAVAAFVPPAHTGLYLASFINLPEAPVLPLFCYTAVGWFDDRFFVPAVRIEQDIRQECSGFDANVVSFGVEQLQARYPNNRVVEHLANNCALTYHCPAARNYFMGRWECPIPASPACNSNCIGCISFQPETESITSSQDRLNFKPTAAEIVEIAVDHLNTAPFPLISFGQGCEGEPLLMWETLAEAILQIRKFTDKGSININTNGSKPQAVEALCKAGLNSIRVSTNSVQKWLYEAYYLPNNYQFEDIIESIRVVNRYGGWTSINYFAFPGLTDSEAEYEALREVIRDTGLKMIQWRNFNIDPDWYLQKVGVEDTEDSMGIKELMRRIKAEFPHIRYGYYNPPMERIKGNFELDFAH